VHLTEQLAQSEEWMVGCADLINGANIPMMTGRHRVSASLFRLSIEHQSAIHLLIDNGVVGSALALLRPQFEGYVRGSWFLHCGREADVAAFLRGREPPKIDYLITDISKISDADHTRLPAIKARIWKLFNDFTHGGAIQVKARDGDNEFDTGYLPQHVSGALRYAVIVSHLSGVGLAALTDNARLAIDLHALFRQLYPDLVG
jgi:hypothetical protein